MFCNNRFYIYLFFLLSCFGIISGSCTEEDERLGIDTPVSLASNFNGVPTRVTDTKWSSNDEIGVYMINRTGETLTNASFAKYKPSGSGTSLSPVSDSLYYPMDGSDVKFVAFAPYPANMGTGKPTNNKIIYDLSSQTSKDAMEAVDFVYCRTEDASANKDKYFSKTSPNATLKFEHKLSKIVINLSRGAAENISDFRTELTGLPAAIECNLEKGEATSVGEMITMPLVKTVGTSDKVTFELIMAHNTAGSRALYFKKGSSSVSYSTHYISANCQSGTSYTYNFVAGETGIVLESSSVTPWVGGEVVWNDKYVIRCSEPEISLFKEACTGQFVVSTNYDGLFNYSYSNNNGFNVDKYTRTLHSDGYYYCTIDYSVTANNTPFPRSTTINFQTGGLTYDVIITQSGATQPTINTDLSDQSNCYIVPPGGTIVSIPAGIIVKRYNDNYCDGQFFDIAGKAMTADVLWSDVSADGTAAGVVSPESAVAKVGVINKGVYSIITVTSGRKSGNAVVAFRDASGTIRWSFHIWVTDYKPSVLFNVLGKGYILDRNLGATSSEPGSSGSLGLLYQFGRKDPFPGSSSVSSASEAYVWLKSGNSYIYTRPYANRSVNGFVSAGPATITASVQNPFKFYTKSTQTEDWCTTNPNETIARRWAFTPGKGIDDPCPKGWRVRMGGTYFLPEVCGWIANPSWSRYPPGCGTSTGAWYPSSGIRTAQEGALSMNFLMYWSDTNPENPPYGEGYNSCLYVAPSNGIPSGTFYGGRANATPIRCGLDY